MTIAPGLSLPEAELAEICRRYGFKELSVFGSVARGETRSDSDVDLLVEFLPGAKRGLIRLAGAQRELESVFGRKVDLISRRGLNPLIRDEVLSQARPIFQAEFPDS
jgi:predicted nucleotidyltransferase